MSEKTAVCFLHGLESSPQGTKGSLIKKAYPDAIIPELTPDLSQRLRDVEKVIARPCVLVGSSLGGLTALVYSNRHPSMVQAMVLMAPAVGSIIKQLCGGADLEDYSALTVPSGIPTTIIAGSRDALIPLEDIKSLVERSHQKDLIRLFVRDDDHNLHNSLDLMMRVIGEYLKPPP